MSPRRPAVPAKPASSTAPPGGSGSAPHEMIEYVADMISELQSMSARLGCGTLAGILALAVSEAKQQSARAGSKFASRDLLHE